MKKQIKFKLCAIVLFCVLLSNIQAQEVVSAAGGEVSGSGGSASYSVGQVVYTTNTGTNGYSVANGVQQPYEISVVTQIPEAKDINLLISAYPNPATDYLTLKIDDNFINGNSHKQLSYQLFETSGKIMATEKITTAQTEIITGNLTQGNYLLRILENNKVIKVFKIVKW